MSSISNTNPGFFLDQIPDIPDTDRRELIRYIDTKAGAPFVYTWLRQLRVAPYSYDILDNRFKRSPQYVIENLPPVRINTHFLLAFHVCAFKANSYIAGRFCEPINTPIDRYIAGLYLEYRLLENSGTTEIWCKVLGFVKKDIYSRAFFRIFSMINRFMTNRQLKNIRKLSEKLIADRIEHKTIDYKNYFPRSGIHWWAFCRRKNCQGLSL